MNHTFYTPRFEPRLLAAALLALLATGCAVGPDYKLPATAEVTTSRKPKAGARRAGRRAGARPVVEVF